MTCTHSLAHLVSYGDFIGDPGIMQTLVEATGGDFSDWSGTCYCRRCELDARRWEDTFYLRTRKRRRKRP